MQLRLGIIGAGPIVEKKHLPALSEVAEIAVSAICRRNEPELHQLADRFRIAKRYTDYHYLLDQQDIDAVLIATGPEAQPQIVMDAAAAGKHIFIEKPMADSLLSARRMADAIQAAQVHFQIGFNKRFYYGYRKAKQLIQKGELGTASGISARFWFQAGRRDARLHNAIHFVDLVHFLMGPVTEVFARRYTVAAENLRAPVSETLSVSVKFESGAGGNLLLSSLASWDYLNEHVDVIGSNQNALSVEGGRRVRLYESGEDQPTHIYENSQSVHWWSGNYDQGFVPQLQAFARTILRKANPLAALDDLHCFMAQTEDGIRSLMVLEAMNNSIAHGSNVSVPFFNKG